MILKILGHEYDVKICNIKADEDGGQFMGLCDVIKGKIQIQKGRNKSQMNEALLHEIIHVIEINNALDLDEQQVATLSTCLFSIMQDNKELFKDMLCS